MPIMPLLNGQGRARSDEPKTQTEAERQARLSREAAMIAQAEADIDAGFGEEWASVKSTPNGL